MAKGVVTYGNGILLDMFSFDCHKGNDVAHLSHSFLENVDGFPSDAIESGLLNGLEGAGSPSQWDRGEANGTNATWGREVLGVLFPQPA